MIKILKMDKFKREDILPEPPEQAEITSSVKKVLADVKARGDEAVKYYTKLFDKVELESLIADPAAIEEGAKAADKEFIRALEKAAANIYKFHEKQKQNGFVIQDEAGIITGQRVIPLKTVGIYVPGGTARYPSTVLMNCIPAKIAGVENIIITTPPDKDGNVPSQILAAAYVAGATCIVKAGGAQAVAALAYGTQSIPKADKIVGPGNAYVAEAKKQVQGLVDTDMIAGPSEILVIADDKNDPNVTAFDLLSQAEHDKMATAVLVTDSEEFAQKVSDSLEQIIPTLPRKEIARASIDNNGKIIVTSSLESAIEASNEIAPEHLELCIDNPFDYLSLVRNAGSVFMGRNCPEALGDYYAGPNHTLPTSGTARFSSPLSVEDFVKKSAYTYYTAEALDRACKSVVTIAEEEGLYAHGRSVSYRCEMRKKG
ncbi:MAG: histidinol dehydrogenase [Clostridia bacterium]|nr:histidinol dehydrogenase [Clostridia bacterium]